MSSDLTRMFNAILIKHFPKSHDFHKLLNKNNTKIAYSCTPNMAMIIAGHNKKLIKEFNDQINMRNEVEICNHRRGTVCPVENKCNMIDVLYKATCTADQEPDMDYFGITANKFIERYRNHTSSFRNEAYSQATTLSSYVWKMKRQGKNPSVTFKIHRTVSSFSPEAGRCGLCTAEKLAILTADKKKITNKRSEILSSCRHVRRHILAHQKRLR